MVLCLLVCWQYCTRTTEQISTKPGRMEDGPRIDILKCLFGSRQSESESETDLLPRRILHQQGICLGE